MAPRQARRRHRRLATCRHSAGLIGVFRHHPGLRPGFFMFEALTVPAINRLLRANRWALDRLKAHTGKTARFACPPLLIRATVTESGELQAARSETVPDVTISVTPGLLLRAAAHDDSAWIDA